MQELIQQQLDRLNEMSKLYRELEHSQALEMFWPGCFAYGPVRCRFTAVSANRCRMVKSLTFIRGDGETKTVTPDQCPAVLVPSIH